MNLKSKLKKHAKDRVVALKIEKDWWTLERDMSHPDSFFWAISNFKVAVCDFKIAFWQGVYGNGQT